jgi:hypothetical protein
LLTAIARVERDWVTIARFQTTDEVGCLNAAVDSRVHEQGNRRGVEASSDSTLIQLRRNDQCQCNSKFDDHTSLWIFPFRMANTFPMDRTASLTQINLDAFPARLESTITLPG